MAREGSGGSAGGAGFHTITLGCKLNQFDTAAIEGELSRRGLRPQENSARARVVIVNTCTVTRKADAEARKLIRGVRRRNPLCRLLVTGCYAEREPDVLGAIPGVDRVFGNRDKEGFARILDELGVGTPAGTEAAPGEGRGNHGCTEAPRLPGALHFGERSRAFLKVQEGCDLACSYCIIPQVRGRSRSVPPDQVVRTAGELFDAGYREIVLTGVNTGDYGKDLTPRVTLANLLRRLLDRCGKNRIRLNSLEPMTVTDEIISLMAADERLCPHLQVPLQSGSAEVLRKMRRNYRPDRYRAILEGVRERVPDAGLGADVIVGFPGETDARFGETLRLIEASPLNYLHVFAWSARPGTPAAQMEGRVPGNVIRERSRILRRAGDRLSLRFRRSFEGRRMNAVVLGRPGKNGHSRALTGNFIEVELAGHPAPSGTLIPILITHALPTTTWGSDVSLVSVSERRSSVRSLKS